MSGIATATKRVNDAVNNLVEETTMDVIEKFMGYLKERVEVDESLEAVFREYQVILVSSLKTKKKSEKSSGGSEKEKKPNTIQSVHKRCYCQVEGRRKYRQFTQTCC